MQTKLRLTRRDDRGSAASKSGRVGRFALVGALSLAMVAGSVTAAQAEETFATQQTGTYAGLPLFDGNPAHLEEYLDVLVHYAGLEASVNWANGVRGDFTIPSGPNAGRVVPGSLQFGEGAQGISTDFPAMVGVGQSWNSDLVGEIGDVIGDEALYLDDYQSSISAFNPMVSAALQDIRPNPLSGRLDEGTGEDPELAQAMVDRMSRGISGIDEEGNPDGFWTKAMVDTKHFTNYAGQWFRRTGSNNVGARALMEYWSRAPMEGFKSGAIGAFMSSYGRTNGVPNVISPLVKEAQSESPWGMYTVPDNGSENRLQVPNAFSNGFDTSYTPTWEDAAALFTIADAGSIAVNRGADQLRAGLIDRIRKGTYGVTEDDVYDLAKDQVVPLIRMGLFNERDAQGLPMNYPFLGQSAVSAEPIDYTVDEHQATGLQAAEESLVLLKNTDGILPLDKDASLAVAGPLSETRFRTTYATNTPPVENGGLTPVQGIDAVSEGLLSSATDGNVVRLKSVATGNYVTVSADNITVAATTADPSAAATFESFAWGQQAYGLRSTSGNTWLQYANNAVTADQAIDFNTPATTLPYRIRPVDNGDGTVSFVVGSYTESFIGGFETVYYTAGRYLTVDPSTGAVGVTDVLSNEENAAALRTDAAKFQIETTRVAGSVTTEAAKDYAVVVVGAPARNSSGEGADRSDLAMGADQYQLVENVSKAYPGRTIVVVSSVYPVLMEQIQNNADVAAIVQSPYGGQYGNYALGRLLFGDASPTGHLTNTWYSSMDALPKLDEFSIPQGEDVTKTLDSIDPRITVDMTAADPADAKLTYRYTDADTTYDFGYGLSYSSFSYSGAAVQKSGDGFVASVDVTNTGSVDTADVVQVYSSNKAPTYGTSAPKRSLAGFAKVDLAPGETQRVTIDIDSEALALWDVNADRLTVEPGTYTFEFAHSSSDIAQTVDLAVEGEAFATAEATEKPINVFDHSFAASHVVYYEASKANTARATRADELVGGYYAVGSRGDGSWTAVHDLDLTDAGSISLTVGSTNPDPVEIEVRTGGPTGDKIADLTVTETGGSEYVIPATVEPSGDVPVKEIAYQTVKADLPAGLAGVQDVYLVFKGSDIRVTDLMITPTVQQPTAEVVVSAKCVNGRVLVTVTATNTSAVPVTLTIKTPFGTKTIKNVAPDKDVVKTFTTRAAALLAGVADITATVTADGATATVEVDRNVSSKVCK